MSLIFARSQFVSSRYMLVDLFLFAFARVSPRLFSIYLLYAYSGYIRHFDLSRKSILKKLLCRSQPRDHFTEAWLFTVQPHMREKTMLKILGPRITYAVTMSAEGNDIFHEKNIPAQHIHRDWIAAWLLILEKHTPERLFIVSGLSDIWFMPLKLHMYASHIAFDSYDPMSEYRVSWMMRVLNYVNYRLGKLYILRDARFKKALRKSGNWKASVCYMPDAPQFDMMDLAAVKNKFSGEGKIKFVSAGWVTAEGDGGILRSFKLIRSLWPDAEIHLCLTQFMRPEDPLFASLVSYMRETEGCYVHQNLKADAYKAMLDDAHVGINLHDPNVFGESYKEFSREMVRRSPSARVLDFATRGCILMATSEQRYSQHMFAQCSPHQAVIHLSSNTKPEELSELFQAIRER